MALLVPPSPSASAAHLCPGNPCFRARLTFPPAQAAPQHLPRRPPPSCSARAPFPWKQRSIGSPRLCHQWSPRYSHLIGQHCPSSFPASLGQLETRAALELPPIDDDIYEAMLDSGAKMDPASGLPLTFGNDDVALEAAYNGTVMYNMTHFGRLRVSGADRIRFLHNQTTNDVVSLPAGGGCFTVFQTPTARTVDLALLWIMDSSVILTVSPTTKAGLLKTMDKYIFPADNVEVADISVKTCQLAVVGPKSTEVLGTLGIKGLESSPFGTHRHFSVEGSPVTVGVGSGVALPGYTLLLSADVAGRVWSSLEAAGVVPMGEAVCDRLWVHQGRPRPGAELTEEYNTLEAGLWDFVSTTKGCYMGQETIARLITYNGVKQNLWGIQLQEPVEVGAVLTDGAEQIVGKVTSCVEGKDKGTYAALGYVKRNKKLKNPEEGMLVWAEGVQGSLKEVPFLKTGLPVAAI